MTAAIRAHLDQHGFGMVTVTPGQVMNASRTGPGHPWVRFALESVERTGGSRPALLPNLGGSLPNDVFTDRLVLPTIWIPHSYPPARSTPRTSTCSPRSPARPCN
jgi:hypothetical protein